MPSSSVPGCLPSPPMSVRHKLSIIIVTRVVVEGDVQLAVVRRRCGCESFPFYSLRETKEESLSFATRTTPPANGKSLQLLLLLLLHVSVHCQTLPIPVH